METFYKYGSPCTEIKDIDLQKRIVQAYYYNSQTIDSDNELILPGAYSKSISERGPKSAQPRIKHLFNHWDAAGTLIELGEDENGGWFVSKLGRHTVGRDVLTMYDDGIITEHSHGFEVVKTDNDRIDDIDVRVIKEGILWEVTSLDKWGANQNTPVIKSLEDRNNWIKKIENLMKALNKGNYSDDAFDLLEIQLKQMQELLKKYDMQSKPYKGWHSARIIDPGKFQDDSFRKKNITDGIYAIVGKLKGESKMTVQAYRFDMNKYTVAQAKKWLKDNDITYIKFEEGIKYWEPEQLTTLLRAGSQSTRSYANISINFKNV